MDHNEEGQCFGRLRRWEIQMESMWIFTWPNQTTTKNLQKRQTHCLRAAINVGHGKTWLEEAGWPVLLNGGCCRRWNKWGTMADHLGTKGSTPKILTWTILPPWTLLLSPNMHLSIAEYFVSTSPWPLSYTPLLPATATLPAQLRTRAVCCSLGPPPP